MSKYIFDNKTYYDDSELEEAICDYARKTYDKYLDENYGDVNICGVNYSSSLALKKVDQVAYYMGRNTYEYLLSDAVEEIDESI